MSGWNGRVQEEKTLEIQANAVIQALLIHTTPKRVPTVSFLECTFPGGYANNPKLILAWFQSSLPPSMS